MKQDDTTGKDCTGNWGYYYLHANGDLIYKSKHSDPCDFEESDLVKKWWKINLDSRLEAYNFIVASFIFGAKIERIKELIEKWEMTDSDCEKYCQTVGLNIKMDGDQFCVTGDDFINLQESDAGFNSSLIWAVIDFYSQAVNH